MTEAEAQPQIQWRHVASLDVPFIEHAGRTWIALAAFEISLNVATGRLQKAACQPSRASRIQPQRLAGQWAIPSDGLAHLVSAIRPGSNNRLRALVAGASAIAAGKDHTSLERWRVQQRQRQDAMREAMLRFDKGESLDEIWPRWHLATGLSRNSLSKVVRGTYTSRAAQLTHKALTRAQPAPAVARTGTGQGRPARFDKQALLKIREAGRAGADARELAQQHDAKVATIYDILAGKYSTAAMREALAQETAEQKDLRVAKSGSRPARLRGAVAGSYSTAAMGAALATEAASQDAPGTAVTG